MAPELLVSGRTCTPQIFRLPGQAVVGSRSEHDVSSTTLRQAYPVAEGITTPTYVARLTLCRTTLPGSPQGIANRPMWPV
jgi:hypothetical protein